MATETICINGGHVTTLKELLRPGLRAVIIGINPSCVSVKRGHYYQGKLGQRLWRRLQDYGVTGPLPKGAEDDAAFTRGFGFADVVRRPTKSATDLKPSELRDGARDLLRRLAITNERPLILFTYAAAEKAAGDYLRAAGYLTMCLPGPYVARAVVAARMKEIARIMRPHTPVRPGRQDHCNGS